MRPFSHWKVSVHRSGATHRFRSPEAACTIGDAVAVVGSVALTETCTCGPQVDLEKYDVEIVAFISDGVDELLVGAGANRKDLAGKDLELLALGLRTALTPCRQASLNVQKGDLRSRADDTSALCVGQLAAEVLLRRPLPGLANTSFLVLDPMCGVGTYLFAIRWALARHGMTSSEFLGVDAETESLAHAATNAAIAGAPKAPGDQGENHLHGQLPHFILGSSRRLPLRSNSVDLIVADPPWGQRHANHAYVKHHLLFWAREWSRVLRPEGIALVLTICSKHFESQVMRFLAKEGLLEIEATYPFDNKGWTQCKLYTIQASLL